MNVNPVLLKELKVKMRGWRAVGIITVYLAILALVAVFFLITTASDMYTSIINPELAVSSYTLLSIFQFALILFIVPALTAGAISGEREKQTLDLLLSTSMSPLSIIIGKLFASLSHIILLIVASLPIFSMIFMFGGISLVELLQLMGFYIATSIMIGSIGMFFSTYFRKTTVANVLTYGAVAFLTLGTLFLTLFYFEVILHSWNQNNLSYIMYINPVTGFSSVLLEQLGRGNFDFLIGLDYNNTKHFFMKPWMINIVIDMIFSAFLIWLSAMKLNPLKHKAVRRKTIKKSL